MTEASETAPDSLRLFFALWPDDATRTALNHTGNWLHQHWGGRRMRADTLHLTLAFLGSTPVDQIGGLIAQVDSIQTPAFELTLDQPGYWRHKRIGWLGPSQPPALLRELVTKVNSAIQAAAVHFDVRPNVPHVTLLRNTAGGEALACESVYWQVREFALASSRTEADGAYYEVVQRWPLA